MKRILAKARVPSSSMNKTEAAYARRLAYLRSVGEVRWYEFEALKLRLGNRCWYTPDFLVVVADGTLELHEVKAMWSDRPGYRDDARVKIRAAAERFPFRFVGAYQKRDGSWEIEEF
jgi:hypothetical protein